MTEENVYENKTHTGEVTEVKGKENASAVMGKFKDVDALARAYSALEAEFTRRSQRLKELERKAENLDGESAECSGAEKLRKNAEARREATRAFDEFVTEVGRSGEKTAPEEPVKSSTNENVIQAGATENDANEVGKTGNEEGIFAEQQADTLTTAGQGNAEKEFLDVDNKETEISAEELFQKACGNEEVRLKIIGEYLSSIGKTSAPLTIGRGGIPLAPPIKAKNFADAGNMALQYFKKGPLEK